METPNLNTDTFDMRRKEPGWSRQAFPWFRASNVSSEVTDGSSINTSCGPSHKMRPFPQELSFLALSALTLWTTADPKLIAFIIHRNDTSRSAACEIVSLNSGHRQKSGVICKVVLLSEKRVLFRTGDPPYKLGRAGKHRRTNTATRHSSFDGSQITMLGVCIWTCNTLK